MKFTNETSEQTWKDRYCKNNETIEENLDRVASYCAQSDTDRLEFLDVMTDCKFFPAGRTMSNAGIGRDLTMNNCFTAP